MKYLSVTERQGVYAASLQDAEPPIPRPGEALVRVVASGLNRADLSQIAGRYPPPPGESDVLGLEVSGVVASTGERVCALLAGGGHAELVAVPVEQLFPLPKGVDPVAAAGIPEAFLTAFVNLVVEAGLRPRDSVLIHSGASGVGLAAIQVAKHLGARVAATTRTPAKLLALTAAGASLALLSDGRNVAAELERAWGPACVDVVLDPVGSATLGPDLQALAVGGRVVFISTLAGSKAELDLALLMKKRARLIGSTLRSRSREEKADLVARFREELLPAFATGALRVTVDAVFPPERAGEAFQRMRENRNVGKLLLDWSEARQA
jgi:putative PIG3 family NAD(P)H quinone oxidoreductase